MWTRCGIGPAFARVLPSAQAIAGQTELQVTCHTALVRSQGPWKFPTSLKLRVRLNTAAAYR